MVHSSDGGAGDDVEDGRSEGGPEPHGEADGEGLGEASASRLREVKPWQPGAPLKDVVPPAANLGDPLPAESMVLREKILEQAQERKRLADMAEDPVERKSFNAWGERQMSWGDRIRGLEDAVSEMGQMSSDDSERLMRIERMLVEVLKKSES